MGKKKRGTGGREVSDYFRSVQRAVDVCLAKIGPLKSIPWSDLAARICKVNGWPEPKNKKEMHDLFFRFSKTGIYRLPKDPSEPKKPLWTEHPFYGSEAWQRVRYQALKKSDGRCCLCGRSRADGVRLHVDHIKPKSLFPDLALDLNNLQVLCADCNLGKTNKDSTDWR